MRLSLSLETLTREHLRRRGVNLAMRLPPILKVFREVICKILIGDWTANAARSGYKTSRAQSKRAIMASSRTAADSTGGGRNQMLEDLSATD